MEPNVAPLLKDVVENLNKKPAKGILKNSSSFETTEPLKSQKLAKDKATKWDEMNIIATLHPADKDYGHMKIDEPKTPFERETIDEFDSGVDPEVLREQMNKKREERLKIHSQTDESDSEPDEEESPEQKEARNAFESKRKAHYNEFFAAKMARKLLEEDEEDEDEDETKPSCKTGEDFTTGRAAECTSSTSTQSSDPS